MYRDLNQELKATNNPSTDDLSVQLQTAAFRSSLILGLTGFAILAFGVYDAIPVKNWLQAGTLFVVLVITIIAFISAWENRSKYSRVLINIMLIAVWAGSLAGILMTSGLGLLLSVGVFVLTIGISVQALPVKGINRSILIGTLVGVAIYLLDLLLPYPRNPASSQVQTAMLLIMAPGFLIFLVLLVQRYAQLPLLTKILVPFVVVSLVSIGSLAAYNYFTSRKSLTDAANQTLRAAALQTAAQVDNYFSSITSSLRLEATLPAFVDYFSLPAAQRAGSPEEAQAKSLLRYLQGRGYILSYSIVNPQGNVLLSTLATMPDQLTRLTVYQDINRADPGRLALALVASGLYISPVIYDPQTNKPGVYFAMTINDRAGVPAGFLISHYSILPLQTNIFLTNNGLAGTGSFGILVDDNYVRLADGLDTNLLDTLVVPLEAGKYQQLLDQGRLPKQPLEVAATNYPDFSAGLDKISGQTNTSAFTTEEAGVEGLFNAVAVSMQQRPWKVVFMQPQEILLTPVNNQIRTTTLFVLLITSIAILAAALIARAITLPVDLLTDMAKRISQGDLDTRIPITSQDEFGSLSSVFNSMTGRLQQTLQGLEQRVFERTQDLSKATEQAQSRSRQLEIITEISRVVTTERDPEQLLHLVVRMISDRMGFYHVGIFLLDPQKEFAILQAANSVGGQRMLERGHRLRVGQQGIIGYVTSTGSPRVALDVGADAVFFNNPDLPETRSEMGLPLRSGDEIIGALDVQSMKAGAFTDEDVALLSTLADQVSIAIENARLFSETNQALTELQSVQRQYLREQWDKTIEKRRQVGFTYERGRIMPIAPDTEQVAVLSGSAPRTGHLSVPIVLRGEQIGNIDLTEMDRHRVWSEEEISLARSVAEQIGLALENARLIEESQQRAEREALVSQISTRLRASNDPQEILQTAVAELRHALRARTAHIVVPIEESETTMQTPATQEPQTDGLKIKSSEQKPDNGNKGTASHKSAPVDSGDKTGNNGTREEK
jgi:GAF domain-containing protein/HAMP domain-containing protein